MADVLVFGWYGNDNVGDETFKTCFKHLWPHVNFTFLNYIPENVNKKYDAVFFGGGDLFDQPISHLERIHLPIGIVGVGYNSIHECNLSLFRKAKIVITRNRSPYIVASDLCFSLPPSATNENHTQKIVSIFANDFLTPRKNSDDYVVTSHNWFTHEFSDVCDELISNYGYNLRFIPLCSNNTIDDRKAASCIISKMKNRHKVEWNLQACLSYEDIQRYIQSSHLVITQRLHGSIFSYIQNVPQVSINHHSKMTAFCNEFGVNSYLNYYGYHKETFFEQMCKSSYNENRVTYLSSLREQWQELSNTITQIFSL